MVLYIQIQSSTFSWSGFSEKNKLSYAKEPSIYPIKTRLFWHKNSFFFSWQEWRWITRITDLTSWTGWYYVIRLLYWSSDRTLFAQVNHWKYIVRQSASKNCILICSLIRPWIWRLSLIQSGPRPTKRTLCAY